MAAANLSKIMGYIWLFQLGEEEYHFGPEHSLTQEVMSSPNLARFRAHWAMPKELGGGGYQLPYWWWGDQIEDTMYLGKYDDTAVEILAHNMIMFGAMWGYGSSGPEGPINTIGGLLGSLDYVHVEDGETGSDMVKMTARNTMGKASVSRRPGTRDSRWKDEWRSETAWGGRITLYFNWEEPKPVACWIALLQRYFRPEERLPLP
jgi:hypothetical protein